jgi:GNAT superfamily N-acetyltransferase
VKVAGHAVRRVTDADLPLVQSLFAQDLEYWLHVEGAPLRDDEARITTEEAPPNVPRDKHHAFLVDDVALLDMLEGYPDEHTWFLGLIFLAPAVRGRGFGTKLLEAVCDHARGHGATALRLAVAQAHPEARRLYDRLGFRYVVTRTRTIYTGGTVELDVLERAL